MKQIFSSPFRVYLCLFFLALIGVGAGSQLSISLYPNSDKPTIMVKIGYGDLNSGEFLDQYGSKIEGRLNAISNDGVEVEKVSANYHDSNVRYQVEFQWGAKPKEALREVQALINSSSAAWPREVRDSAQVNFWSNNSGFIAISFFSDERDLNDLYKILEPAIVPALSKIDDADNPVLWNPNKEEVRVIPEVEVMATLNLMPRDIEKAIKQGLSGTTGGSVRLGEKRLPIQMPKEIDKLEDLKKVLIPTPGGELIHLNEVADIEVGINTGHNRSFKTNGAASLILFANPRSGGNVKRMAEEILDAVKLIMPKLPKDVQYRVLVDPSEFIRSSVKNVLHEVFLAAALAVLVLFLFIGSFKNTITAAIEIPLSMILAFILMKLTGMNLNLISLGGLALSAGMNVDASVVVMENIFRHFESAKGPLNYDLRLKIIIRAVREVMLPVMASTIASLVVFVPLAFTSDLTYAILGDLAKAVVFSHGFSAFVAIILVPTIRLHIMGRKNEQPPKSPIEGGINWLENSYAKYLGLFIASKYFKYLALTVAGLSFLALLIFVVPNLKKEIIGTPDTDWMILSVNTRGNTVVQQMEAEVEKIEADFLEKFRKDIKYTFTQMQGPNQATIMARLRDKKSMGRVWKAMEKEYQNSPTTFYWVGPWNPAELPIPDPPHMKIIVKGGEIEDRALMAGDIRIKLKNSQVFPRIWSRPGGGRRENIVLKPHISRWAALAKLGARFRPNDLSDLSRVATEGRGLGKITLDGKNFPLKLQFKKGLVNTKEDLEALPVGVAGKIVPLKALADVELEKADPAIYRQNNRSLIVIQAKQNKGDEGKITAAVKKAKELLKGYREADKSHLELKSTPQFYFEDAQKELNDALKQLGFAIALSILLIFITLLFQFGGLGHSLIVLTAIPWGIMGVATSLFISKSTLSLNSALGVILLNGIAVANSIILVDFIRKLYREGMRPKEAAVLAAQKRLRPILITSLTTILGMLPIAFGMGEGGKILQPLGISVSGGLWVSMVFTLFAVPLLEVMYLEWIERREMQSLPPLPMANREHQIISPGIGNTDFQDPRIIQKEEMSSQVWQ